MMVVRDGHAKLVLPIEGSANAIADDLSYFLG